MLIFITLPGKMIAWLFVLQKVKRTRPGRNSDQVWHVYATPNKPCVCPVLALSKHIFANPGLANLETFTEEDDNGNLSGCLFPGGDQY